MKTRPGLRRRAAKISIVLAIAGVVLWLVPRHLCGRHGEAFYTGAASAQIPLARAVAAEVQSGVDAGSFVTGSDRFDGEWALVTYQMAALGLVQVALEHPEAREELLPAIDLCLDRLVDPRLTAFGTEAWSEDGLSAVAMAGDRGHAYLGYANLALGARRLLGPGSPHEALNDRLSRALARRFDRSRTGLIETYPVETYPPDVAVAAASVGLNDRVSGQDHGATMRRFAALFRGRAVDPDSGLLFQRVRSITAEAVDAPRASGTALAAYALSFSDRALSRELFDAVGHNERTLAGFGGILEYATGSRRGLGDIDSGPVLLGVGVSSSGFAIAGARVHGARGPYERLLRTAVLFGLPLRRSGTMRFATGGPLGNAIMLAMLTAGPAAAPADGS